jgi:hypothetical protein
MPKGTTKGAQGADVGFGIAELSEHKSEGFDFLAYMLNEPNLLTYWQTLWVAYPALKAVWYNPEFKNIVGIEEVVPGLSGGEDEFERKCQWQMDAYENGWVHLTWNHPLYAKMRPIIGEGLDGLLLKEGAMTPSEVAESVNEKLQKVIDENPI